MPVKSTLGRAISPPPIAKKGTRKEQDKTEDEDSGEAPTPAAIEAGKAEIRNHLHHFCHHLEALIRVRQSGRELLSIPDFASLYQRNQHANGHHFAIHQHNHPIAGVLYDLRLQFSVSSTISFAIPYGLPGNPNSRRPGRLAIETRVHNLWNSLIESASHATGSLLIWETGEYEVLPRKMEKAGPETDDSNSDAPGDVPAATPENEKLIHAFQTRYVRLHSTSSRPQASKPIHNDSASSICQFWSA